MNQVFASRKIIKYKYMPSEILYELLFSIQKKVFFP